MVDVDIVCRFEPPAAAVFSLDVGANAFVVQSIESVPKATQGFWAPPLQVEPVLFTVEHKWSPAVGNVKFNGTAEPILTRFNEGGANSPENPVNVVTVLPVVTAAAFGSNAATQHEVVPLPLPFSGSKVTEGAVYELTMLRSKPVFGQLTKCCPRNAGPPIPFGKLLASML